MAQAAVDEGLGKIELSVRQVTRVRVRKGMGDLDDE